MKTITGTSRPPMQFTSMDDLIASDNPVRIIDALVEKLDLKQHGILLIFGNMRASLLKCLYIPFSKTRPPGYCKTYKMNFFLVPDFITSTIQGFLFKLIKVN